MTHSSRIYQIAKFPLEYIPSKPFANVNRIRLVFVSGCGVFVGHLETKLFLLLFFFVNFSSFSLPLTADKIIEQVKTLHSVEELLHFFSQNSPTHLENFTLLKGTHSRQSATPAAPRVILFGADAKLIATFDGGGDLVEIIQYQEDLPGPRYTFYEVSFHQGVGRASLPNPGQCRQCHFSSLRPIWEPYEIWPQAYGSRDDALIDFAAKKYPPEGITSIVKNGLQEYAEFTAFEKTRTTHARYRYLKPRPGSPVTPYSPGIRGDRAFRPNLRLTLLLADSQSTVLATQLATRAAPDGLLRKAVLASLLGCLHERDARPWVRARWTEAASLLAKRLPPTPEPWSSPGDPLGRGEMARLLLLSGFAREDWSLARSPAEWSYLTGDLHLEDRVAMKLYALTPGLPRAKVKFEFEGVQILSPAGTPPSDPIVPIETVCGALSEAAAPPLDFAAFDKKTKNPQPPAVVSLCLSCHDGAQAPALHFDSPTLRASILRRTAPDAGKERMPPNRELTLLERYELLQFLSP